MITKSAFLVNTILCARSLLLNGTQVLAQDQNACATHTSEIQGRLLCAPHAAIAV